MRQLLLLPTQLHILANCVGGAALLYHAHH